MTIEWVKEIVAQEKHVSTYLQCRQKSCNKIKKSIQSIMIRRETHIVTWFTNVKAE